MVDTAARAEATPIEAEATGADTQAARRTRAAFLDRSGRRGAWFEVRTLMGWFEIDRLSPQARSRMTLALDRVGLCTEPELAKVNRRDTVVLTWTGEAGPDRSFDTRASLDEVVTLRVARPGQPFAEIEASSDVPDGVRWFDVSRTSDVDVDEFLALVNPHCNMQLNRDMIVDLLTPDPRPKVTPYEGGAVRGSSAFRVRVEESDDGVEDDESQSIAGVLVFDPVEMIVAEDWIISCWHDAEVFRGARRIGEQPQTNPAGLADAVERSWRGQSLRTGGDIATALLYELSLTFKPAAHDLRLQVEEWELDFFRRPDRLDDHTLLETYGALTVLRDWLVPLNRAGIRDDSDRAWFPAISGTADGGGWERAKTVDDRIGKALGLLDELAVRLRSAYDLLQLRQSERERKQDEKFQRGIALGGAAILIPTLLAGVMGANTWVPGEYGPHSSHWPFYVLIFLIVAFGATAWWLLARMQGRESDGRPANRGRTRREPPSTSSSRRYPQSK